MFTPAPVTRGLPPLSTDGVLSDVDLRASMDAWVASVAIQRSAWCTVRDRHAAAALDAALVEKRTALSDVGLYYYGAARRAATTLLWEQVAYVDSDERKRLAEAYASGELAAPSWSRARPPVTHDVSVNVPCTSPEVGGPDQTPAPSRPTLADWPPAGRWAATDPPQFIAGGYESGVSAGYRAGFLAALAAARGILAAHAAGPDILEEVSALAAWAVGPVPRQPGTRVALAPAIPMAVAPTRLLDHPLALSDVPALVSQGRGDSSDSPGACKAAIPLAPKPPVTGHPLCLGNPPLPAASTETSRGTIPLSSGGADPISADATVIDRDEGHVLVGPNVCPPGIARESPSLTQA
jgi:hypothetical protein